MAREKSPGLKILWLWTVGTAAVLVANVVTTRLRDMQNVINSQDESMTATTSTDSVLLDTLPISVGDSIQEEKS
ncbi:hypothetical protein RJ641_023832 [Dillenia turbinata]|uniref:Uncharacterized protein n=1 Tax=Dillenia turbinata TaxID=194707 RepID=A0AAN8UD31_9MAGN